MFLISALRTHLSREISIVSWNGLSPPASRHFLNQYCLLRLDNIRRHSASMSYIISFYSPFFLHQTSCTYLSSYKYRYMYIFFFSFAVIWQVIISGVFGVNNLDWFSPMLSWAFLWNICNIDLTCWVNCVHDNKLYWLLSTLD